MTRETCQEQLFLNFQHSLNSLKALLLEAQSEAAGYPSRRRLIRAGLKIDSGVAIGKHAYIDRSFAWAITIGKENDDQLGRVDHCP